MKIKLMYKAYLNCVYTIETVYSTEQLEVCLKYLLWLYSSTCECIQ